MLDDPIKGFVTKTIGFVSSEKVVGFQWSGAGDIFNVFENEGGKNSISFYMISVEQQTLASSSAPIVAAPKGKPVAGGGQVNKLTSQEEKYEFKKTGRHDIFETKFESAWDQTGRYLCVWGVKRSPLDKTDKSVRFYSIFGEPLGQFTGIQMLQQFKWRPRPIGLLPKKEVNKLQSEYKTKYQKLFKEEEKVDKKQLNSVKQESKKKIREEFLNTFFLPLRKEFENQKDKYEALWPIKPSQMAEQLVEIEIIYSYENVVSETKIQ